MRSRYMMWRTKRPRERLTSDEVQTSAVRLGGHFYEIYLIRLINFISFFLSLFLIIILFIIKVKQKRGKLGRPVAVAWEAPW